MKRGLAKVIEVIREHGHHDLFHEDTVAVLDGIMAGQTAKFPPVMLDGLERLDLRDDLPVRIPWEQGCVFDWILYGPNETLLVTVVATHYRGGKAPARGSGVPWQAFQTADSGNQLYIRLHSFISVAHLKGQPPAVSEISFPLTNDWLIDMDKDATSMKFVEPDKTKNVGTDLEGSSREGGWILMDGDCRFWKEAYENPTALNLYRDIAIPALRGLQLLNCSNVEVTPHRTGQKSKANRKKRRKRGGGNIYKVLRVKAKKGREAIPLTGHRVSERGGGVRQHTRRGHFRDYSSGAGLFGRTNPTKPIWVPAHYVSKSDSGRVVKSYEVEG